MAEVLLVAGIVIILFCLLLTLIALVIYSGLLEHVSVGTGKPPIGEATIAYKFAQGPYKEAGQLCSDISLLAPTSGPKVVCIYYDDPKLVPSSKLRYAVGAILSEDGKPEDEDFKKKLLDEGYKMFKLPSVSFAVSTFFPYRSTLSIFMAIFKVYPAMESYIQEHRLCAHPMLEIYDADKMHFMAPLAKQSEFYVEEAEETGLNLDDIEDADSEGVSYDESMLDSSVSRSEASATTFMGEASDDDDDTAEEGSPRPSELSVKSEARETIQRNENSDLLDSGFNSEQVTSPDISPQKSEGAGEKSGDVSDGNESGSSFEEIQMDTDKQFLPSGDSTK
ncbi:testis-expressed protein 264-like [Mizuhopecten yessoensis]|uniref:Testis-expressed sequence 264 protein n=1 Tax=Mizuhopecten yessoensis TaxID=6573 RepID=A0A210QWR5_MIZYE|nr:testis-expressed protein 264-like [Mizuhopecten yessoensis]OWF53200.1 hypothetical protein KP79_PYT11523 [Mizuhopecten yessoensis]